MIFDNPTFSQNFNLPTSPTDGQTCFLDGVGLYQFVNGQWALLTGSGGTTTAIPQPISQKYISSNDVLLYIASSRVTVKELTLVTTEPVEITVYLKRQGAIYKIFDRAYFDGYLTTIVGLGIPLEIDDELYATATNGPGFSITLSGYTSGAERLIVAKNVMAGTFNVFDSTKSQIVTNVALCNIADDVAETTLVIKRSDSTEIASVFLNQLLTQAGEVVLADFAMAIDTGSTIQITTDKPVSLLITAQ